MSETTTEAEPSTPPASSGLPFTVKMVGGFVVVAIVVGIGLMARELTGGDELTLPDKLAGLAADDSDAALDDLDEENRDRARDNAQSSYEYNSEQLSEAYDGAEAATRSYGALEGELRLTVTAVRADTGPPVPVTFDDPEVLRTEAPRNELVEEGDVTCLISRVSPPPTDSEPSEEDLAPSSALCQRSGGDLTVRVFAVFDPDVDEIVDATNEVWEELS